jgi:hypothetical protein
VRRSRDVAALATGTDVPDQLSAQTEAVRRAVARSSDPASVSDLLFLERWEMMPEHGPATALRVAQLRRANPELVAAIRSELSAARVRPLSRPA